MQKVNQQLSVRLALLFAAVCTVFLMIGGAADADVPASEPIQYVVMSGDTLWGIASTYSTPGSDVRRLIHEIATLSDVSNGLIFPGQVLQIPVDG